ncbi:hypothetical protein DIZ81_06505 [Legionella taurinensis]|uniref:Uncharacterized protein n=1 Tax=Legionella taurinensis TaxID=70611 RepID=A0A3A5L404_9GAMM|nr:hypothetical protein DB744_06505 [Legionella taurinensis]PUT44328.1 hypothetical protein DB746_04905 [Legionella taurinensis]PUT48769.1 hypothetical protein DB745_04905 [Legionella taurinensis]RJT46969.1 hypothetical protein D6J04_08065 [Legionella taurinensis]TID36434.1 hypothetical protein DIZ42_06505 [Legionella taurinensis]
MAFGYAVADDTGENMKTGLSSLELGNALSKAREYTANILLIRDQMDGRQNDEKLVVIIDCFYAIFE